MADKYYNLATKMLLKHGMSATWKHYTGAFSPSDGSFASGSTTSDIIISPPLGYAIKYIDGEMVQAGDTYCFTQTQLTLSDTLTIFGTVWRVIYGDVYYSKNGVACYEYRLRK